MHFLVGTVTQFESMAESQPTAGPDAMPMFKVLSSKSLR